MSRWARLVVVCGLCVALLGSGCTSGRRLPVGQPCPSDAFAGVLWGSEQTDSLMQLVSVEGVVGDVPVGARGIPPAPRGGGNWANGVYVDFANGDARHDKTHIVRFSPETCSFSTQRVDEPLVLGAAASGERTYTVNTLNAEAVVHAHLSAKPDQAVARFPGELSETLIAHEGTVYTLSRPFEGPEEGKPGRVVLRALDGENLKTLWEAPLPLNAAGRLVGLHRETLVVAETYSDDEQPGGDRLLLVDLRSRRVDEVHLGEASPMLVQVVGDFAYVGHTFMNPALSEFSDYRTISRVDLKTKKVETFKVDIEISQFIVDGDKVWILGGQTDEEVWLNSYSVKDLRKLSQLRVERPRRGGFMYPAGFVLLPRPVA